MFRLRSHKNGVDVSDFFGNFFFTTLIVDLVRILPKPNHNYDVKMCHITVVMILLGPVQYHKIFRVGQVTETPVFFGP